MANVLSSIVEAFEDALSVCQAGNNLPIIQSENKPKRVGASSEWLRISIMPARSIIETYGPQGFTCSQGIIQIDIFYPDDNGAGTARGYADVIMNYFTPGKIISSNGVNITVMNTYPLTAYQVLNNYQLPVRIEYKSWNNRELV